MTKISSICLNTEVMTVFDDLQKLKHDHFALSLNKIRFSGIIVLYISVKML